MRFKLGAGSALLITLALAGAVAAQSPSESPAAPAGSPGASAAPSGDVSKVPHPAHIHTGTCANLGDVVAPLNDVTMIEGSDWVSASTTQVDLSMDDILSSPHAIMAHASAEQIGVYIACADLTGAPDSKRLVVALDDQNESGFYGVAFLQKDGGKTQVELSLTAPEGGFVPAAASGSPGASMAPMSMAPASGEPAGGSPAASGQSVTIENLAFNPNALTVPVGTTVTWTNNDSTQHTVTADDGSFDSGVLQQGATFTQTFTTAGTFAYHCNIHSSMTGTITVQ